MAKLIFGCGYLGQRVAQRWREAGQEVFAVTRSPDRAEEFRRHGHQAIVADVTRPDTLGQLPVAESVLFAVGYDRSGGSSIREVYADGVRNVLSALSPDVGRFIYVSTTGVYGSADGAWVDEVTPPDPQREGGRASWAAEQALDEHPIGQRSIVLRLAGIYGPGRIPFIRELRAGEAVPAAASGWLNLIHVDDAAAVVLAADEMPLEAAAQLNRKRVTYCVSDGVPVERGEFYSEVARQIAAPPPKFVAPDTGSPRALRAEANRRISNARMLADLRVTLEYPDYRAGVAAALETQNQ